VDMRRVTGVMVVAVTIGAAAPQATAQQVQVWLTTNNQRSKLEPQTAVSFGPDAGGATPVVVDESVVYQEIEGFGASFTDSAAWLLNEVASPEGRDQAMTRLFTRQDGGIGLGFVRNPMGASDLARTHYSYDDLPPGQSDPSLALFSIAHDQEDIIPLLLQARTLNPALKVMGTPWSPPGWMKTSGSLIGGSLLPSMYDAFAQYFVKYVQAYAAAGVPVDYVSLQNEPLYVPNDYPGMSMDASAALDILKNHMVPAFTTAGLSTTRVLVYDHNWDRPDYPQTVLADPALAASPLVAGVAWHGYGGTPGAMSLVHDQFAGKGAWQTEHSGGTWVANQVQSDFEEIAHVLRNWGRAYVKWSLALDQNRGPHAGGCGTCTPLVTVNTSGAVSYPIEFYTLGHFSRFMWPGARRIYSSNAAGIVTAAAANPDGSKVLVAFNESRTNRTFQIRWAGRSVSYTLPGLSGATFVWWGAPSGTTRLDAHVQIQASSYTDASGLATESCTDTLGGFDLGFADGGDRARFGSVDFGGGVKSVDVRVASAGSGGTLEFHLDDPAGPLVSAITVPVTGGWQSWTTVSGAATGATGVHDLYLVFSGGSGIGNVNWFRFK
jgi:glucosylceramidase